MAKVVDNEILTNQQGSAVARVGSEELEVFPHGLTVGNDAMYVLLDSFEGPLDLLLYLVRKNNLNILEFRLAEITAQFNAYVELMTTLRLKRVGDYLVMAATLLEIKSKALLPRQLQQDEDEVDQELELRRRLLEYERLKRAAEAVDALPRMDRDSHETYIDVPSIDLPTSEPQLSCEELLQALAEVLTRAKLYNRHRVNRVKISIPQRIQEIKRILGHRREPVNFNDLFKVEEGVASVVASFLAILTLVKGGSVTVAQKHCYSELLVTLRT